MKELRNAFPFVDLPDLTARYNIAPTQQVAAIRMDADAGKPEFASLRWGFLPPWAKTPKDQPQPPNHWLLLVLAICLVPLGFAVAQITALITFRRH